MSDKKEPMCFVWDVGGPVPKGAKELVEAKSLTPIYHAIMMQPFFHGRPKRRYWI